MATTERELRLALEIVTEGPAAVVPKARIERAGMATTFRAESLESQTKAEVWLRKPSVQAIGLGEKVTEGKKLDTLALRIYVDRKIPLKELENPIPKTLMVPTIGEVITDVVEIGKIRPEVFTSRVRPMMPGCGVGHVNVSVGTFGYLARKRGGDGRRYILSNSHVLADSGLGSNGDNILQAGKHDGGVLPADVVARLAQFVPFNYTQTGTPNLVDAAIAEIELDAANIDDEIRLLGIKPVGVSTNLQRGMRVQKVGRTTDHSWGEIVDIDARPIIPYDDPNNPGSEIDVAFRDQVICTRYTAGGDSGSLVLNERNFAVGLHFAGSESSSIFNKIDNVLTALDIELDI